MRHALLWILVALFGCAVPVGVATVCEVDSDCGAGAVCQADGACLGDEGEGEGEGEGAEGFNYEPTNFQPGSFAPALALVLDCGQTVTFDSSTGSFTNLCPGQVAPTTHDHTDPDGNDAALLALTSLRLDNGTDLRVIGDRPVILAVYGAVELSDSIIDAGGRRGSGGPGALSAGACVGANGSPALGGGGGGGGGNGTNAPAGGAGEQNGTPGQGGQALVGPFSPLVGGCAGGRGANNVELTAGAGGPGGGGLQISAAGTVSLATSSIRAGGGGGNRGELTAGGGGGGSGGTLLIEAESLLLPVGSGIFALGGGGGAGGDDQDGPGDPGGNGTNTPGVGGGGRAGGGDGGRGGGGGGDSGAGAGLDGPDGGGGGGGGAVGQIRVDIRSGCFATGTILPSAPCE